MTKAELAERGVNFDNMNYPFGEMNIIVMQMAQLKSVLEPGEILQAYPDVYQPRKNRVWSCSCSGYPFPLDSKTDRENYISHLKDSSERLKIMSILLAEQAKELEQFGEIRTSLYYPKAED
jgi:hypothetical protein